MKIKLKIALINLLYYVLSIGTVTLYYYIGGDTYLTGIVTGMIIMIVCFMLDKLEEELKGGK